MGTGVDVGDAETVRVLEGLGDELTVLDGTQPASANTVTIADAAATAERTCCRRAIPKFSQRLLPIGEE